MTVVIPTDRTKSVCNRCVIEVLVVFLSCPLVFEYSVGIGYFVIGMSQISFFFSLDSPPLGPGRLSRECVLRIPSVSLEATNLGGVSESPYKKVGPVSVLGRAR